MRKGKKILITIISILAGIISIVLISAYFLFLHHYKGTNVIYEWNATDEFDINTIATVEKEKDKNFVILNLADVQMCDLEDIFHYLTIKREIDYLVKTTKPDLITLTGDQTWSNENLISLKVLISWLDSYKIPYAPVFGNHDYGNQKNSAVASLNFCCDLYERGTYSLFKRGPSNLGTLGNYVFNIVEDSKILETVYMMDSGYEEKITDKQIEWFEWNANGIMQANNGEYTQGIVFMHKPLPEYSMAYRDYQYGESDIEIIGNVYSNWSTNGSKQNGFFEVAKSKNVVDIVCGHQHGNNWTIKYRDVRLTFAVKTGELGGYFNDGEIYLNGATVISLNESMVDIQSIYVDENQFHIKGSKRYD